MMDTVHMVDENRPPKIGAGVLETLTTGMYRNPYDTLREYIQNAFDSIRAAERQNVLAQGAGRLEVNIDGAKRLLAVRDNGVGVPASEVFARLVHIGMSTKNLEIDAGFRGIGRLAGIAYCENLVFRTQAVGENEITTVTFDAHQLKKAMWKRQREELSDVIGRHVSITTERARHESHFFEVRMEMVNTQGEPFLNQLQVRDYLMQVAPLGLDTHSFLLASKFFDWLKSHNIDLPTVSIVLKYGNTSYELFKPYKKLTYSTKKENHKIHVRDLRFYPEDAGPESPFWIWYAETNCPGAFADDLVGGFRLRKANISIGLAERMAEIFGLEAESYARFNNYFMGEVHIQEKAVIPNAHRDDFEDTPEWALIKKELVSFAKERSREAHQLSQGRNADIAKLLTLADKQLEAASRKEAIGLASKTEQAKLVKEHDKHIKKLEAAQNAERNDEEQKQLKTKIQQLTRSRDSIETTPNFTANKLNASLDKKQRKVISEIISILYEALDQCSFEKAQHAIYLKFGDPEREQKK